MTIKDRLANMLGFKASDARIVSTLRLSGQAVATPANYENFSKLGYGKNAIAFKCIHMISTAVAGIEWEVYSKRKINGKRTEIEEHPLKDLLSKPNPMQSQAAFFEALAAFYLISGNTYIEGIKGFDNQPVQELWPVRPDRMKIVPGAKGYPAFFEFSFNGVIKRWPVDPAKLTSNIMHMKSFNPLNDWYGMSALEAGMYALDSGNFANRWNLSLLQNSATPSGVLQVRESKGNPRGELTEDQYGRIRTEFEDAYTGAKNAGRPIILEGGLEWTQISLSPKEMDFLNSKEVSATELAMIYGVPPELLGLGVKTYNNYKEARLAFYEDTILPLMDKIRDELNRWLAPQFGDVVLEYDKDDIEALVEKRESKYATLKDVNWLTLNEKRKATGWDEAEGGDIYIINNQAVENLDELITEPVDETQDPNNLDMNDPNNQDIGAENDQKKPRESLENGRKKPASDDSEDDTEGEKGFKSFNLINENERRRNYKAINSRRKRLEKAFSSDLEHAFNEMNDNIVKAAQGKDARLAEYAMLHELSDSIVVIKSVLKKHIGLTLKEFGGYIFNEAKSTGLVLETKANTRKFDDYVHRYIERRTGQAITQIEGTTKKKIHQVVKRLVSEAIDEGNPNPELAGQLRTEFDSLTNSRSNLIARTEVASASNNGSLEAVKALDIPNMEKEWVSVNDDRTRDGDHGGADHSAMDGVRVSLDEKFTVPPDADMECPGDMSGGADQVCNCRCTLVYKMGKNENEQ